MTTTFATQVVRIKARMNTDTTAAQPTDPTLPLWCIDAFKIAMGELPPITVTTATVSTSAYTATVVGDWVYFVNYKDQTLFSNEWSGAGTTTLRFQPGSVDYGGTITYYRFNSAVGNGSAALTDASTTVDTTCIFGTDWLEEYATTLVLMRVHERLASVSPSGDGPNFMATYRIFQEERDRRYKLLKARWDLWMGQMQEEQQARAAFGDLPLRESAGAGLINHSRIINRTLSWP